MQQIKNIDILPLVKCLNT